MIEGIHHVAISTGDIERSLNFYCGLLGFEQVSRFGWEEGSEGADRITGLEHSSCSAAMLKLNNAFVELFEFATPSPRESDPNRPVCDHGITHLCVAVSDIDAEYERLKAAGMRFHCPPQGTGGSVRATYGRDPDGNVVELLEIGDATSPMALR